MSGLTNTRLNMKFEGYPVSEGLVAIVANGLSILAVVHHVKFFVHLSRTLMCSGQVSLKQIGMCKTSITMRTCEYLRVTSSRTGPLPKRSRVLLDLCNAPQHV